MNLFILVGTPQSFPTWVLWAFIDVIAAVSIASKGGSFLLPAVYAVGSILVSVKNFPKGPISFSVTKPPFRGIVSA